MALRRTLWAIIGVMTVVIVVSSALTGWLLLRSQRAMPVGLVVFGADSRLRLLSESGVEQVLDEQLAAARFRFPATSPDGRQIVYVTQDDDALSLQRLDLATGARHELYRSAVNKPFNVAWSPDGRYVNFLLVSPSGLSVHLVPADGSAPAQLIATGKSSYYAWKRDSSALLLHLDGHALQGGHIDRFQPGMNRAEPLAGDPGLFQAPAWSLDGDSYYYVAQPPVNSANVSFSDVDSQIRRANANGGDTTLLVSEKQAFLRLARAPNSDQLAYVTTHIDQQGRLGAEELKLIDGDTGGAARAISRPDEHVTAFFWSPDGEKIAYLSHSSDGDPDTRRSWHVVDVDDGELHDYGSFTPSAAFADLQQFFDAYLFSFSPWSPDSHRLAFGADDGVYVLDITTGVSKRAADGLLGMWVGGR